MHLDQLHGFFVTFLFFFVFFIFLSSPAFELTFVFDLIKCSIRFDFIQFEEHLSYSLRNKNPFGVWVCHFRNHRHFEENSPFNRIYAKCTFHTQPDNRRISHSMEFIFFFVVWNDEIIFAHFESLYTWIKTGKIYTNFISSSIVGIFF